MNEYLSTEPIDGARWRSFMVDPVGYAEPRRLAEAFDGAISEEACERMLQTERVRSRLATLLLGYYRLSRSMPVGQIDPIDREIALADRNGLHEITIRAGAIYWAGSLADIILGWKAAALHEALSEEVCAFAIANRDLAGPVQPLEQIGSIRERAFADGLRCLGAWCHAVPVEVGTRVRLKLPPDELIDRAPIASFAEIGPDILRRAAG